MIFKVRAMYARVTDSDSIDHKCRKKEWNKALH